MTRLRIGTAALLLLVSVGVGAAEGVRLRVLATIGADAKGSGLKEPEAVAFDGRSLLVVADTGNGRLLRYTVEGDKAAPAGEIRLDELPYPIKVQIDSRGQILALDGRSRRIARIAPAGEFKGYVSFPAEGAAPPVIPRSFQVDRQDRLYALDIARARVLVLGPDGKAIRQIAYPRDAGFLSDIAVDAAGVVFAVDSVRKRVWVARPADPGLSPLTGEMKSDVSFPAAMAADDRGRIFLADTNDGGIVILGTDGSFRGRQSGAGWKEGLLRYPSGLCAVGGDRLYVADRENNRVQVFEVSG